MKRVWRGALAGGIGMTILVAGSSVGPLLVGAGAVELLSPSTLRAETLEPRFSLIATPSGKGVELSIGTDKGIHVNREAPGSLTWSKGSVAYGAGKTAFVLPEVPAEGTSFTAKVFLCDDAKTWCKPIQSVFTWQKGAMQPVLAGASGATAANMGVTTGSGAVATAGANAGTIGAGDKATPTTSAESNAGSAAHASSAAASVSAVHYPGAIQQDAALAFQRARAEGKLVFIDFYGIWCPPCQLLMSEGMMTPGGRELLDQMVVLQLDADSDASWALKSRYQVTGYPTIVVTNASGIEVGRMLGFSDTEGFISWLKRTTATGKPMSEWIAKRNTGDRSPEVLVGLARGLQAMGLDEEAVPLFREAIPALSGDDLLEARAAVLAGCATRGPASEAVTHGEAMAKSSPLTYEIPMALGDAADKLKDSKLKGAKSVSDRLAALAISTATAVKDNAQLSTLARSQGAEALGLVYQSRDQIPQARAAFSASADMLLGIEKELKGQGAERYNLFRGQAHALLDMLQLADRMKEADEWYQKFVAAYPEEFSYHFTYSSFLQGQNRLADARREADLAFKFSYGDNRLRASMRLARIMSAQGEKAAAATMLKEVISTTALPDDPTVRTHRYLGQVKQLLSELSRG